MPTPRLTGPGSAAGGVASFQPIFAAPRWRSLAVDAGAVRF